jgi:N-acetylglutamate synthase-like GNAT family acetyltransferase
MIGKYFMENLSIRLALDKDAPAVCEVLRRSIVECCLKDHKNNQAILDAWLANKTPENVQSWISSADSHFLIAEKHHQIVGAASLSKTGVVLLCYLSPDARFLGVGKALLLALEDHARRCELKEMTLSSTETGYQFYLRNGFKDVGKELSSFGTPCIKMSKALSD